MNESELVERLSTLVRELWDREMDQPTATGLDSYGARYELERFVERTQKGAFVGSDSNDENTLMVVMRLIKRTLAVDMNNKANRKGEVPAALGLTDRADVSKTVLHRVIFRIMEEARHNTGVAGRSVPVCAELVSQAFKKNGTPIHLEPNSIRKIYQRILDKGAIV